MKKTICCLLLTATAGWSVAQPLNRPTYSMMISMAEEQMEKLDYYRALEWYEKAYDESKDRELAILMADLNYLIRDYRDAEKWYSRALKKTKKDKEVPEEKRFEYARTLKMMGKYDDAIEEFDRYLKTATDAYRKELAELEKLGCEFGKVARPQEGVNVLHAGKEVNTKNSEYSAWLTNDNKEMYFSGFGTNDLIVMDDKNADDAPAKIMKSTLGDKGWSKPAPFDESVNRIGYHNVNVSLSPDGKRMFFNRELLRGNELVESKVYFCESNGSGWKPAVEVPSLNGDYLVKSPCVGELFGKEVLFFVSDMEGGEGGYDIYYATYKGNNEYGEPVNLGPRINSIGNEDTPFYREGILYFSSNGHPGIGGYDIFMSTWNGTTWSKAQNMSMPYNSSADDLYFMLDQEGYHGFLTSNRISEGARSLKGKTCTDDIYNVILKKITADLVATTFDLETQEALNGVTIELFEVREGTNLSVGSNTNPGGNNFEFPLELDKGYLIVATADNYESDTLAFNTVGLFDSKTFQEKLALKPGRITKKILRNEPFVLENILYDFDDDKILTQAEGDLKVIYDLLLKYPDMVIELSSHTDARGAEEYNRNLSQRRAESARRWLTRQGIDRARIEAKGYGETQPKTVDDKTSRKYPWLKVGQVLSESFVDSLLPDSVRFEAAHQLNRRTEFKILAGPTSITIEEEQLIQIGNRRVDGETPPKAAPAKSAPAPTPKPAPNNRGRRPSGGNSVVPQWQVRLEQVSADTGRDSVIIHPLSSLYGKKDLSGMPIMQFESRVHDMGKVKKGDTPTYTFTYTNMGDVPLEIDLVSVCECTDKDYSPSVVQPGEKGWIKVVFNSDRAEEGSEGSDVDIYLKNIDPEIDAPIFERVRYTYQLVE
ncbi:MAG: hypothetical protein RLY31_1870 [Bacteroidota bacterium]|jgi:peptidoglycan-associated lipoprotein